MTSRYELLISSIASSDHFMVQMFLFALVVVCTYPVIDWSPPFIRRPLRYFYLASMLAISILVPVYSWLM